MTPKEQAKALLPCMFDICREGDVPNEQVIGCPAYYRPAVAAALAEKDRDILQLQKSLNHINDSCLRAEAERDQLKDVMADKDIQLMDLYAERDHLKDRIAELEAHVCFKIREQAEQVAAAKIEGLKDMAGTLKIIRQYLVTGKWQQPQGVLNFIDAEIAKLEKQNES